MRGFERGGDLPRDRERLGDWDGVRTVAWDGLKAVPYTRLL